MVGIVCVKNAEIRKDDFGQFNKIYLIKKSEVIRRYDINVTIL